MMKKLPADLPERFRAWLLPMAAVCLAGGILLGSITGALLPCALAAGAALLAAAVGLCLRRVWPLLLLAAGAGMLLGWLAWHPALPAEATYEVTGVVCDEIVRRETDTQVHTWLTDITINGERYRGRAYWSFYADKLPEGLAPGASVRMTASLYEPGGAENEGGFDFRVYALQHGASIGLYGNTGLVCEPRGSGLEAWCARVRADLSRRLYDVMGDEAGGYASAMLLGIRSRISADDRESFNALGIGHILSVSGFHVGVLYGVLLFFMRLLRVKPKWRPFLAVPLLAFYCMLTGGHAPVVRASILCVADAFGRSRARTRNALHMLSIAAIVQLCWDPVQLTSAGFQLSYGAMLGLLLITPAIARHDPFPEVKNKRISKAMHAVWTSMAAAVGAQLGVLLPELYWYQELPLFGILANMLLLALAGMMLMVYWACLVLMFIPGVGQLAGTLASAMTNLFLGGVRAFDTQSWMLLWTKQPGLIAIPGMALVLFGLCAYWRRRWFHWASLAAGVMLMAVSLMPLDSGAVTWTQLSVGAADAGVLRDGSFTLVVDTGEDDTLASWLHRQRRGIDVLVLSHLHSDHVGGLEALLDDRIPIGVCYISACAEEGDVSDWALELLARMEAAGTRIERLAAGDVMALPSGQMTVLWPELEHEGYYEDANDGSLVLLCEVRGVRLLLTGDLTAAREISSAAETDILKVAHHGSSHSTTEEYLELTGPQVLLLSSKEANETRFRARYPDETIRGTASEGMLTVRFEGDGAYTVEGYLR